MKKTIVFIALTILFTACGKSAVKDYHFDGKPSDEVLNNYLDRAITMAGLLTDSYPDKDADIDFIVETGTKFVGRAVCIWGGENIFNSGSKAQKPTLQRCMRLHPMWFCRDAASNS